jgi:hypothetical protein
MTDKKEIKFLSFWRTPESFTERCFCKTNPNFPHILFILSKRLFAKRTQISERCPLPAERCFCKTNPNVEKSKRSAM